MSKIVGANIIRCNFSKERACEIESTVTVVEETLLGFGPMKTVTKKVAKHST